MDCLLPDHLDVRDRQLPDLRHLRKDRLLSDLLPEDRLLSGLLRRSQRKVSRGVRTYEMAHRSVPHRTTVVDASSFDSRRMCPDMDPSKFISTAFCSGIRTFFEFFKEKLGVTFGRLIQVICDRKLVPRGITFTLPELDVLDYYDRESGLEKLEYRSAEEPIRVSSLLHCRTIHNILLHIAKVTPAPPLQIKITMPNPPEKEKPQLVISFSSTEEERTVQLKSKVVVPAAKIILPGEKDIKTPFVDCHCHLNRLFNQPHHQGSLDEYFYAKGRFISPFFMGCITVFSDPPTFMSNFSIISTILSENGVNCCIG